MQHQSAKNQLKTSIQSHRNRLFITCFYKLQKIFEFKKYAAEFQRYQFKIQRQVTIMENYNINKKGSRALTVSDRQSKSQYKSRQAFVELFDEQCTIMQLFQQKVQFIQEKIEKSAWNNKTIQSIQQILEWNRQIISIALNGINQMALEISNVAVPAAYQKILKKTGKKSSKNQKSTSKFKKQRTMVKRSLPKNRHTQSLNTKNLKEKDIGQDRIKNFNSQIRYLIQLRKGQEKDFEDFLNFLNTTAIIQKRVNQLRQKIGDNEWVDSTINDCELAIASHQRRIGQELNKIIQIQRQIFNLIHTRQQQIDHQATNKKQETKNEQEGSHKKIFK